MIAMQCQEEWNILCNFEDITDHRVHNEMRCDRASQGQGACENTRREKHKENLIFLQNYTHNRC